MPEALNKSGSSSKKSGAGSSDIPHKVFTLFLIMIGLVTAVTIWARNYTYYLTPLQDRPTLARYDSLRPSGIESHGYGIIGTAMIFVGVAIYSGRKRLRRLSNFGKIRDFLDIHIFLCLLGPILVLYHTTFMFGGIAGAGFWCMTAVVLSGFVGRYFYKFIPKNIHGGELTAKDLEGERSELLERLRTNFKLDEKTLGIIDRMGQIEFDAAKAGILQLIWVLARIDLMHRRNSRRLKSILRTQAVPESYINEAARLANRRIALGQRILVLEKLRQIFHYWHVIHLPFSLVVLVILIVHVGVAFAFGYTWIF